MTARSCVSLDPSNCDCNRIAAGCLAAAWPSVHATKRSTDVDAPLQDAIHEDLDGDGVADLVHEDVDGDGVYDLIHEDIDGDGVVGPHGSRRRLAARYDLQVGRMPRGAILGRAASRKAELRQECSMWIGSSEGERRPKMVCVRKRGGMTQKMKLNRFHVFGQLSPPLVSVVEL